MNWKLCHSVLNHRLNLISVIALLGGILATSGCKPVVTFRNINVEKTMVLYNSNATDAREIAEYYAVRRGIASSRICAVQMPPGHYATKPELLGAVRTILRDCLCPLIPSDVRPEPCDSTNIAAVARISPISHLAIMKGLPARLRETGWATDAEEPPLDYYLAHLFYKPASSVFGDGNYGFVNPEYRDRSASYRSVAQRVSPDLHRMVVYGRVEAMDTQRTKDLIDRTLAAERSGVEGNLLAGAQSTSFPKTDQVANFLWDLTSIRSPECQDYVSLARPWPFQNCRVGISADGRIPVSRTIPQPINVGMYLGPNPYPNGQASFNGSFESMLKFRKNTDECIPLCKDLPSSLQDSCREKSTDYFREINTDCVKVAKGFLGHQVRSWPVQYYGVFPPDWSPSANGATEKIPPRFIKEGGYQDDRLTDTGFLRFGEISESIPMCTMEDGTSRACPEQLPINMSTAVTFNPLPTSVDGQYRILVRFRYRNPAMLEGRLRGQVVLVDSLGNAIRADRFTISMASANSEWRTFETVALLNQADILSGTPLQKVFLQFTSTFAYKLTQYLDLDAFEIIDEVTGAHGTTAEREGMSEPYLNNLNAGDYATNVIDRLGGIAWWGSGSHHLTNGWAFANSLAFAGGFFSGRSLGESVFLAGTGMSGTIYGDPLYTPVAARLYIKNIDTGLVAPTYDVTHSSSPESAFQVHRFSSAVSSNYRYRVYLNVLNGTHRVSTTRWKVEKCVGEATSRACDSGNAWITAYSGTDVGYEIRLPIEDLRALVSSPTTRQTIFLRLKVWDTEEESQAFHSFAYLYHYP